MRAFAAENVGQGLGSLSHRDVADLSPIPGHLKVRVHAVALNSADIKVLEWRDGGNFVHGKAQPYIPGYDFSGVVEEVGTAAKGFVVGDEVFGFLAYSGKTLSGTCAEFVLADANKVAKKPAKVSHVDAACLGTAALTSLQGWRDKLNLAEGQRALVHGASGGVGTFAVQVAKILGAHVTATCSAAKADIVRGLGADEVVDYRQTPLDQLEGPFDAIFDAAAKSSYGFCKPIMGAKAGYLTLLPSLGLVTGKLSALFSRRHCEFLSVNSVPADLVQIATWADEGKLNVVVGGTHSFDDADRAFADLASGKPAGKVAIQMTTAD